MKEIVKRLLENHSTDVNDDVIAPEEEDMLEESEDTEDSLDIEEDEELDSPEEEEINESDAATVSKSAQRVLNTYENIINTIKGMQKGSGYLASNTISKQLTPADYKQRESVNQTILKKLDDINYVLDSIKDIVRKSK